MDSEIMKTLPQRRLTQKEHFNHLLQTQSLQNRWGPWRGGHSRYTQMNADKTLLIKEIRAFTTENTEHTEKRATNYPLPNQFLQNQWGATADKRG